MKRIHRNAAAIAAALVGLAGLALLAAWLALPGWIETRLAPDLARRLGLAETALEVRHIGLTGIDAASIHIGKALTLDHLAVDFRPRALAVGRIEQVVLSGLTIRAVWDEIGIRLAGTEAAAPGPPAPGSPPPATAPPPLWVGRVEVRGGLLVVQHAKSSIEIPFSLEAMPETEDLSRIKARLVLFAQQGPVDVMLRADTVRRELRAVLEAHDTRLDLLAPMIPPNLALRVAGRLAARAEAHLTFSPVHLLALHGEASLPGLHLSTPDFELAGASGSSPLQLRFTATEGHDLLATLAGGLNLIRPMSVSVDGLKLTTALAMNPSGWPRADITATGALGIGPPWDGHIDKLSLKATGVLEGDGRPRGTLTIDAAGRLAAPLPLTVGPLHIEASGDAERIDVAGNFTAALSDENLPTAMKIIPAGLTGSFSGRMDALNHWQASFRMRPAQRELRLTATGLDARITKPQLRLDLDGDRKAISFTARLGALQGRIDRDARHVLWPELNADAKGTLALANPPTSVDARFAVRLTRPSAVIDDFQASANKVFVQGRARSGTVSALTAQLEAEDARIASPARQMAVEKISLRLPFQWPPAKPSAGTLVMETLHWQGLDLGRLHATIRQKNLGLAVKGTLQDVILEGVALDFSGQAAMMDQGTTALLDVTCPPWSPPAPIDLGSLTPAGSGLTVDGHLAGGATLALDAGHLKTSARITLTGASVAAPEKNLHVAGIETDFELVDLVSLRSAPGQVLRFSEAGLGSLRLTDGRFQFQVEAPQQILLEKGAFGWCSGQVYAEAMRFSPAVDDYALTLFCDRLRLAQLLDQLGGLAAEGQGSVNGRIPLHYRQGRLSFSDGFLYSSPGDGGKIRVTGAEGLTAGIAPETLEYAQLALASEALKDYDYTWAKVGIDSQDQQLTLRLQFDGKPARPLPFVYRKELGRFVRVEADASGSNFQGISLDVNFRLPLDQILKYGGLMKMIH